MSTPFGNHSFVFSSAAGKEWTKFNVGQYGYYRVQYPVAEWQKFGELMQNDIVS